MVVCPEGAHVSANATLFVGVNILPYTPTLKTAPTVLSGSPLYIASTRCYPHHKTDTNKFSIFL